MIKPDVHRLSHIHGDVIFYEVRFIQLYSFALKISWVTVLSAYQSINDCNSKIAIPSASLPLEPISTSPGGCR